MFYQTYTARKAAEITPGSDGMAPSAFATSAFHSVVAGVIGVNSAFFVPGYLDL